jgi:hypothetical protein
MDRLDTIGLRHERVTLIFDQDFEFVRRRLRLFEELKKRYQPIRERVAQVSFADSRSTPYKPPICSLGRRGENW